MISQGEYIIFILIVSLLLYTRPNVLVNFSKSTIGKIILLVTLVIGTLRSTFHGILIALVIVVFAEQIYEGFTDATTQQITINGNQMLQTPDKTMMVMYGGTMSHSSVFLETMSNVRDRVNWKFTPVSGKTNYFHIQNTWHKDPTFNRVNWYLTYTGYDAIIGPGQWEWELIKTEKPGVFYIKNGCTERGCWRQDYLGYNSVGSNVNLTLNKTPSEFYIDGSIAPTPAPAPTPSNNVVKINVSNFITWDEANKLASDNNGRLPTKDEFKAASINLGNIDMWMPAANGTETNFWVHVGTGTWPLYGTQPGVVPYPPPWGLNNTPANYRPGPGSHIYIVKNQANASTELKCPEGYEGPNASGDCTAGWTNSCGESCAKDNCSKGGGQWLPPHSVGARIDPLNPAHHLYTCKMKAPKPACGGDKTDNGFVNFPYEYIEQHTNADTDVVATDTNAQYFKVKTQTMTGCAGGSHQFRIHTPAYKPSEGDTAQITINEYTGVGKYVVPTVIINAGKWYHKDGQIPILVYNPRATGCMNGTVTLSILILKGNQ